VSLSRCGGNSDVYVYEQGGGAFTIHTGSKAQGKKFRPYSWTVYGREECEKKLRELMALGARVPDYVFERLWDCSDCVHYHRGAAENSTGAACAIAPGKIIEIPQHAYDETPTPEWCPLRRPSAGSNGEDKAQITGIDYGKI